MSENKQCGYNNDSVSGNKIEIPNYLPSMLTEWAKAAIRTYPSDILQWSAIYFRMKANGEHPPVKPYLEPPDLKLGPGGLTPNCLKALAITLSNASVPYEKIEKMWEILSLDKNIFLEIIQIGKFDKHINPKDFIGISAAYLNNRLRDTMVLLCDTFSSNDSNGILLEHFVSIYQFLARLDCADVSNQPYIPEREEKVENLEENTLSYVSQSLKSPSLMNSDFKDESESNIIDDFNFFDTESTKGIPVWVDDNKDPESITDILNDPTIEPPINTTICDPKFLVSLKQLKHNSNNDDLLSLLSDSSIISDSDQSIVSFVSSTDSTSLSTKSIINVEELNNEEMANESVSSKFEDFNFDEKDVNDRIYDDLNEITILEKSNETSVEIKYEHDESVTNVEMDEDNNITNIEVNKDFIVMLALVSNGNGPSPNTETVDNESENTENESSTESDFSLLERTELNDNVVELADDNKVDNIQTFDENNYINVGKESSDSEKSSVSDESHYSEIDQQSNLSVALENNSMLSAGISIEIGSKDNENRLSLHDASSTSIQFEHMEVGEEFDENEKHLDFSKISLIESEKDQSLDVETYVSEEVRSFVLPGIGPAITEKQIKHVIIWVTKCASRQKNVVQPHNLLHFLCPPLDLKFTTSSNYNMDSI